MDPYCIHEEVRLVGIEWTHKHFPCRIVKIAHYGCSCHNGKNYITAAVNVMVTGFRVWLNFPC